MWSGQWTNIYKICHHFEWQVRMSAFNGVGIPRGQLATSFHTNTDYISPIMHKISIGPMYSSLEQTSLPPCLIDGVNLQTAPLSFKVYTHHMQREAVRNLPKISPPSKIRPPPFFKWSCYKGCFSLEVRPPIYAAVHAVMLSKKHHSTTTMTADMHHCCYCVSKRMTKEALHNHCMGK